MSSPCNGNHFCSRDSRFNRPESVSLASLARQLLKSIFAVPNASLRTTLSVALYPGPPHGVPVRGPGNNSLRMRLIKTACYA